MARTRWPVTWLLQSHRHALPPPPFDLDAQQQCAAAVCSSNARRVRNGSARQQRSAAMRSSKAQQQRAAADKNFRSTYYKVRGEREVWCVCVCDMREGEMKEKRKIRLRTWILTSCTYVYLLTVHNCHQRLHCNCHRRPEHGNCSFSMPLQTQPNVHLRRTLLPFFPPTPFFFFHFFIFSYGHHFFFVFCVALLILQRNFTFSDFLSICIFRSLIAVNFLFFRKLFFQFF